MTRVEARTQFLDEVYQPPTLMVATAILRRELNRLAEVSPLAWTAKEYQSAVRACRECYAVIAPLVHEAEESTAERKP